MDNNNNPLGFFITWTVYGTYLQGDARWWRKKRHGSAPPQPRLAQWHRDRLKHDVLLLNRAQRVITETEIQRHCAHREWKLWKVNARTNHVHVVVTAKDYSGKVVRDQLKANCTRGLRKTYPVFVNRPVWTVGGDWVSIHSEAVLQQLIEYAGEAQDRMDRKNQ